MPPLSLPPVCSSYHFRESHFPHKTVERTPQKKKIKIVTPCIKYLEQTEDLHIFVKLNQNLENQSFICVMSSQYKLHGQVSSNLEFGIIGEEW